jgi:hemoglobin-like flavoprotein
MGPDRLAELRAYFAAIEPQMPGLVAAVYHRLFEIAPEARSLFKGDLQEQQAHFALALNVIVKLTRSSQLWPVDASKGTASLPAIGKLGAFHASLGITAAHFGLLKPVMSECCRNLSPAEFTPRIEEALGFIIDVLAGSLMPPCHTSGEELASRYKLPEKTKDLLAKELKSALGEWEP